MTHDFVADFRKKFPHPVTTDEKLLELADVLESILVQIKQRASEHPEEYPELRLQCLRLVELGMQAIDENCDKRFFFTAPLIRIFNIRNGFVRFAARGK